MNRVSTTIDSLFSVCFCPSFSRGYLRCIIQKLSARCSFSSDNQSSLPHILVANWCRFHYQRLEILPIEISIRIAFSGRSGVDSRLQTLHTERSSSAEHVWMPHMAHKRYFARFTKPHWSQCMPFQTKIFFPKEVFPNDTVSINSPSGRQKPLPPLWNIIPSKVVVADTLVFQLNEYSIELNHAKFKFFNQFLN